MTNTDANTAALNRQIRLDGKFEDAQEAFNDAVHASWIEVINESRGSKAVKHVETFMLHEGDADETLKALLQAYAQHGQSMNDAGTLCRMMFTMHCFAMKVAKINVTNAQPELAEAAGE